MMWHAYDAGDEHSYVRSHFIQLICNNRIALRHFDKYEYKFDPYTLST